MSASIEILCACYAPSPDCAWTWMRVMHEQGFELRASSTCDVVFYSTEQCIAPAARGGVLVWLPTRSIPASRELWSKAIRRSQVHFPDPVAAAIWWGVERTNQPPAVESLSTEDVMLKMPPFPPPWVGVDTNQPPAVGWVDTNQPPPIPRGSTSQAPGVSATARSQPGKGPTT